MRNGVDGKIRKGKEVECKHMLATQDIKNGPSSIFMEENTLWMAPIPLSILPCSQIHRVSSGGFTDVAFV